MEGVEQDLQKLLAGEVLPKQENDLCFLKPDERWSSQKKLTEITPIVKRSVCYIAMALIFNEEGKMCLIQEAKESCRGQWYVPAGRVEPGENLIVSSDGFYCFQKLSAPDPFKRIHMREWVNQQQRSFLDGVKREVLEEAGIEFTPLSFTCLESYGSMNWHRLNYVGKVTGGKLKTLAEADGESLQAQWFSVKDILAGVMTLRHRDFFKSMKLAQEYMAKAEDCRHPLYDIGIQPHKNMIHRPVIVRQKEGSTQVLCYKRSGSHFPCCHMSLRDYSLMNSVFYVCRDVFQIAPSTIASINLQLRGLLTIEHCGVPSREHDGLCITSVVMVPDSEVARLDTVKHADYSWHTLNNTELCENFLKRINTEGMLIPCIGGS